MNKKVKQFIKNEWLLLTLIIISFIAGWYLYPMLPNQVPMHWNIKGEVDNYGSKLTLVLALPGTALGTYILMLILPLIDPKRKNYNLFEGTYKLFRNFIVLFFIFIYAILLMSGLGYNLLIDKIVVMGVGVLFIGLGNYMGRVRQNFFVGIKTPWTLSDNEIWNKTHRVSGKLWVLVGILMMITIFLNAILTFVLIIISAFFPLIYSYILFVQKGGKA